ncbi:MAG: hypothetical protein OER85_16785 [Gammaproteobacteria bacterium]|nr:hypothetical protein [Gammaproteobacteria bacterium]
MAWMRLVLILTAGIIAACGGQAELTCDELRAYQLAVAAKRVQAPEDLDALDPLREMPLPEASPRSTRPPGSPCIDMPPKVNIGG